MYTEAAAIFHQPLLAVDILAAIYYWASIAQYFDYIIENPIWKFLLKIVEISAKSKFYFSRLWHLLTNVHKISLFLNNGTRKFPTSFENRLTEIQSFLIRLFLGCDFEDQFFSSKTIW